EQVAKIRRILTDLDFDIATPSEARAILHTKGGDQVELDVTTVLRDTTPSKCTVIAVGKRGITVPLNVSGERDAHHGETP
ncbi:hypothetical protein BZM27_53070, partial [Paraburkholderia steynii]